VTSDVHHLAAAYALDALDDTERALFEAHYPDCEVCRVDVEEFRATTAVLAAAHAVPPSQDLKAKVMAEVARTRQLSPRVPPVPRAATRRPFVVLLAAAAAIALVFVGIGIGKLLDTRESGYAADAAAILDASDVRIVDLDASVPGAFRVAWSPTAGRAVVMADGLAPASEEMAYELWLIDADGPHPMHLLDPAEDGSVRKVIPVDADPAAWGVTIEPAAGSLAPTSDVIFSATV
jgi:hypothetical protein